ncbi:hypothetical protein DY000_02045917 [Brassica cretica]|uniref:Uncharacterized protein n=1 Tax=Brassica cretica TaxID=69181 RepID=A0ABQ7EW03_BRACR|nr:hypothetical protein DY000_02045917 [Brassica cretica]
MLITFILRLTGIEVHRITDALYSPAAWRTAYAECINPVAVLESEWNVPAEVKLAKVLSPTTRKSAGRPIKRSIRELLTRWFYERRLLSSKHLDPLTAKVERKIDRRIVKAKGFQHIDSMLITFILRLTGMEVHRFTNALYSTAAWRTAYAKCINPVAVLESKWNVSTKVKLAKILPPKTRQSVGRPIQRRYESVEDNIKSSQGSR